MQSGGTDFRRTDDIERLKAKIKKELDTGNQVLIHMAPPCSAFSQARDRSGATRLRSLEKPEGLRKDQVSTEANNIATNAYDLCLWSAQLGCRVTLEHIAASYLWAFLDKIYGEVGYRDLVLSQCRFGTAYRKDTKFRSFGCFPAELEKICGLRPPQLDI